MLTDQQVLQNFALFSAETQMIHDNKVCLETVYLDIIDVFGTLRYNMDNINEALDFVEAQQAN